MRDRRHDATGRSTGKTLRRKHAKIEGQFAPRTIEMLRSAAMGALSLTGRRILDRLEIELADHGGTENGRLPVTYDDFEHFGIHRHQIAVGMAEVVALGFVEVTRPGRAGNAEYRLPTLYRLTYRPTEHAAPTNEWKRIASKEDATAAAKGSRKRWRDRAKKQIPSGDQRHVSVAVAATKNGQFNSAETATTGLSAETATTIYISGRESNISEAMAAIALAIKAEMAEPTAASPFWA